MLLLEAFPLLLHGLHPRKRSLLRTHSLVQHQLTARVSLLQLPTQFRAALLNVHVTLHRTNERGLAHFLHLVARLLLDLCNVLEVRVRRTLHALFRLRFGFCALLVEFVRLARSRFAQLLVRGLELVQLSLRQTLPQSLRTILPLLQSAQHFVSVHGAVALGRRELPVYCGEGTAAGGGAHGDCGDTAYSQLGPRELQTGGAGHVFNGIACSIYGRS